MMLSNKKDASGIESSKILALYVTTYITILDPTTGVKVNQFLDLESGFRGGVRTALADVDADGSVEIIAASGPGKGEVRVFELDGGELTEFRISPLGSDFFSSNDLILGNDYIDGGEGSDTVQFSDSKNRANLSLTGPQDTGDGVLKLVSIENVFGGGGDDRIKGNKFSNLLKGEDGKDKLFGRKGDDIITGNNGNDKLFGGEGDDVLLGGSGKDVLKGGAGIDEMWGGDGMDTFRLSRGDGYEIIEDFTDGEDRIFLGAISSDVSLVDFDNDVLLMKQSDLLAVVKNGAGKLQLDGEFLI